MSQDLTQLTQFIEQLQRAENPAAYEYIEILFGILENSLKVCQRIYTSQVLSQWLTRDEDSLIGFAIALRNSLNIELDTFAEWKPILEASSVPDGIRNKIDSTTDEINKIANSKSELLKNAGALLSQEDQLQHDANDYEMLQQKLQELSKIQRQLENVDLEEVGQQIAQQESEYIPKYEAFENLQSQKEELNSKIQILDEQQRLLEQELEEIRSKMQHKDSLIQQTASENVRLTQVQLEQLSQETNAVLTTLLEQKTSLEEQRAERLRLKNEVQTCIQESNECFKETEVIRKALNTYYERNRELGQNLPINKARVGALSRTIEQALKEFDLELSTARERHEELNRKVFHYFGGTL
jgi:DNA repair exonuclease SbcCD ATPase subunit